MTFSVKVLVPPAVSRFLICMSLVLFAYKFSTFYVEMCSPRSNSPSAIAHSKPVSSKPSIMDPIPFTVIETNDFDNDDDVDLDLDSDLCASHIVQNPPHHNHERT